MLILLPPSEGKTAPRRGAPLDLGALAFPELTPTRERVLDALHELAGAGTDAAARTLGVDPRRTDLIESNGRLRTAPTARAERVFTGVLFDALDLPGLDAAARRRAARRVAVASAAFGLVRVGDRIPDHRLSAGTTLPGLGRVDTHWRAVVPGAVEDAVGAGLLLDLRSQAYVGLGAPALTGRHPRSTSIRVLVERADGGRGVVSHANKATKGRIARDLLAAGATPRRVPALADTLRDLGWRVETDAADPHRLDVVVAAP